MEEIAIRDNDSLTAQYAYLRVRDNRLYGSWSALQNVIQRSLFGRDFTVAVSHITLDDIGNRFAPVRFTSGMACTYHDTKTTIRRSVRIFTAQTAELPDAHIQVLLKALVDHGCCRECESSSMDFAKLFRL